MLCRLSVSRLPLKQPCMQKYHTCNNGPGPPSSCHVCSARILSSAKVAPAGLQRLFLPACPPQYDQYQASTKRLLGSSKMFPSFPSCGQREKGCYELPEPGWSLYPGRKRRNTAVAVPVYGHRRSNQWPGVPMFSSVGVYRQAILKFGLAFLLYLCGKSKCNVYLPGKRCKVCPSGKIRE
jgi:hypothetical protein